MLPEYQLQIKEDNYGKNKNLVPNKDSKRKYILHYQNLKFYRIEKKTRKRRQQNKKKQNAKLRNILYLVQSNENPMNKVDVKIMTTGRRYLKGSYRQEFRIGKQSCNRTIAILKREV